MIEHRARFVLTPSGVVEGGVVRVAGGRIVGVGSVGEVGSADSVGSAGVGEGVEVVDHGMAALVPGLVNAHSHAFQRVLRGRTEHLAAGREDDDFWSWRTAMYRAANGLSPDDIEAVSAMAFLEMAAAGITTVGEFHYLHHGSDGTPYSDRNELAHRVIRAARRVGIRIVLLRVAYERAGFGKGADALQRRFVDRDVEAVLASVEGLEKVWVGDEGVGVGVAPHSVRAVGSDWLRVIGRERGGRVVHVHACEQRAELVACEAEYGRGPVDVLAGAGLLDERVTLVHGTHLDEVALSLIGERRPTVCACPLTEANLGDGMLPAVALLSRGVAISLGSDGQSRIDPWAEMSRVEEMARLSAERRNVLARFAPMVGGRRESSAVLWPMGTVNGARCLGLGGGSLSVGGAADFVVLDLGDPVLAGASAGSLAADVALGMSPRAVRDVYVGGEVVIGGGRHREGGAIGGGFARVMGGLG